SATTNTMYTYALTSQEFGSGAPSIRFVNPPGVDATASDLFLDWVAITSQNLQYSLEVRQNITGIVTASSAALVVKGNTSAGGESYHVHAWNFTRAAWDVLLVAPFTTTSAYHNVSLTTSYLLAGTVRVRFVDAASQDTIGWALSLDFVAVVATNVPPTVGTAGVSPSTGTLATAFTFYVTYVDAEDDAPLFVNLTLDGVSYVMSANNSADTTYADGKEYYVTVTIANRGTFNYSFSTRASIGDMVLASTPVRQVTVSNRGPTITTAVTILTTYRNSSFAYVVDAVDPDPDALSWSLRTNATFLSIGAANGTLAGLTLNVPSTYWVEVTVSDAFGGTDRLTFTLALVNRPPQVLVTASETGRENELYEASFSAIDPDGDPVGWSLATNATWLALNPSNATLAGIALPGVYYVNLTASDAYGGFAFRNFTIRIAAAPIVRNEPDGLGGELFLLIVIVAALGVLIGALLLPRRRQLVDQAFLIDQDGEIRFHYSTPGAPFDEAKLWSHLQGQPWRDMTSVAAHPHTLHVVRREGLHWILVSRSSDSSRVIKAAEKLFMAAQMDLEAIGAQIPAPEVNTGET
ncbi:MAG TPA: putative Ig domain-containing protein, partial [Thermoplasmata archaeon]